MMRVSNVYGYKRWIFNQRIRLGVFLHFIPQVITGKLPFGRFVPFLKRLLYFVSRLQRNKFVKIGPNTRIDLYVPGYPSEPFYTACSKFLCFDKKMPDTTVLVSVTSACRFKCGHCYQKHDTGKDIDIAHLIPVVKRLQDLGVSFFNIEGGDPFLVYDKLKLLCEAVDERSEIWINSTGDGITEQRLVELKKRRLTAIMFSMHSPIPSGLNEFMGSENAWQTMTAGVDECHKAGVPVAFNICLVREGFHDGRFEALMENARNFGAAIVQIIKPKPAGGWLVDGAEVFTNQDFARVEELVNKYNHNRAYRDYPAISAQMLEESSEMFGCTAGGTDRFYINAKGDVQPCEFLNISFGNIASEDFDIIYSRMRMHFDKPCQAWLCEACSGQIRKIMQENGVTSLPLDAEMSKKIYLGWDRGEETELYSTLRKIS